MVKKKLTVKEKKFVAEVVKGATQTEAYLKAYNTKGHLATVQAEASRTANKPHINQAIDAALNKVGATPEFAVQVLADVAEQTEEIGARRLAAKDILELHGWRKDTRPQTTLQINNSFFTESIGNKQVDSEVIDV